MVPSGAQTAIEAGCEDPNPGMVELITAALLEAEGRALDQVAAVTRTVDGIDYIYTAGNVYLADGHRDHSAVVWITPGFAALGFSSDADVS